MNFSHNLLFGFLTLLILSMSPSVKSGESLDTIVAIVNNDVVMASELHQQMGRLQFELRQRKMELPPQDILQKQALERLILLKIQLQLAKETGIQIEDDMLNRAISNIAAENKISLEQFHAVLEREGYDFGRFREDIRDEIAIARLRQKQVDNLIHVTDREIDSFLATQSHQGQSGGDVHVIQQTHARHVLITPNELTPAEEAQERLRKLKVRIESGENFAELARAHSVDKGTAAKGGDLGWVNPGDLVPKFEEIMNQLKPGEISPPFETDFGWHIVQVLERRNHDSTNEVNRTQAREAIRQRKLEEERQAWLRRLRDEAYVEYRE
jgi:peptidyl-prolyl cis-trans isomerase SurA